jgi:site-specific recombinase XerC
MEGGGYSVYQRKGSPYWQIAYYDPKLLKRVARSSGFRHAHPGGYKRALDRARKLAEDGRAGTPQSGNAQWDSWVEEWLRFKHGKRARSLAAELHRWSWVRAFLTEKKIQAPAAVTYQNGLDFMEWRQTHRTRSGKGGFNNALQELRLLGRVMREAVRRGFVTASPLERMGIKREKAPEKPEITDDEVAAIRAELVRREGYLPITQRWMTVSFEIALHQGCRLSETSIPLTAIDEIRREILFHQKGDRPHLTRLHATLLPLIAELRAAGAARTCELPRMAAKHWHWFLKGRHDKGHESKGVAPRLCFHCTRVTVITRMARAGVPIQQCMRYVGHADATIHRIYQRLQAQDLARCEQALEF